jgi:hypothetical protein
MRELKFRAWYDQQKKYQYGELKMFKDFSFPLYWCKVEQYTGFKDSKGNDIYEGDILEANPITGLSSSESGVKFLYHMDYYNGGFNTPYIYRAMGNGEPEVVGRVVTSQDSFDKLTIIGNVNENNNLIKTTVK